MFTVFSTEYFDLGQPFINDVCGFRVVEAKQTYHLGSLNGKDSVRPGMESKRSRRPPDRRTVAATAATKINGSVAFSNTIRFRQVVRRTAKGNCLFALCNGSYHIN